MGERTRELFTLILGDLICFSIALWLTLFFRYLEIPSSELLGAHVSPFTLLMCIWLVGFFVSGLYDKHTMLLKRLLLMRIFYTQIVNVLLAGVFFLVIPFGIAPKTNLIIYLVISIILITIWRIKLVPFFSPKQQHRAILIADGEEAIELADEINNNDRYNYYFVRILDSKTISDAPDFEERIVKLVEREGIKIIVADPRTQNVERFMPTLFKLSFLNFAFTFLEFSRLYEDTFDRVPVSVLKYDWFLIHISQTKDLTYDVVKRGIDILGATVLMIPFVFLFPFVALAIKLEDKGPLFYKTERVGQFNKIITIFKFRSKTGVDVGDQALKSSLVDTRVGAFLRKTRIDELPQLVNVLRGDLSFIGPRPEMPALAEVYAKEIPYYNSRHLIKPGLSGWAQINNFDVPRGGVDVERTVTKVSYDLWYLRRRSLLLDMQIALKTFSTIIMRTGT